MPSKRKDKYGRRPNSRWTAEEIQAVATTCKNRGEFFTKHKNVYMRAYNRNILDQVCSQLPPSQKKNRFVQACVLPANILAPALSCQSLKEFMSLYPNHYNAGRRFKINFVELFDNIDNLSYIKKTFQEMYSFNAEKLVASNVTD